MSSRQEKYFSFPLFMMRPLFENPRETLFEIFSYGFYKYVRGIKLDQKEVADRLAYSYYADKPMDDELKRILERYESRDLLYKSEEYRGFNGEGEFEPDNFDLMDLLKSDSDLQKLAYRHGQFETALFNIKTFYGLEVFRWIEIYKETVSRLQIPDKEPFPQISIRLLSGFTNNQHHTPGELAQFAAYIAIKSITGKSKYRMTNKAMVTARMMGYKSHKEQPDNLDHEFMKYNNRYHFERLRDWLELKWNIRFYSIEGMRGFYVGDGDQLQNMADDYAMKQMIYQREAIKQEKQQARQRAESKIKEAPNDTPNNRYNVGSRLSQRDHERDYNQYDEAANYSDDQELAF